MACGHRMQQQERIGLSMLVLVTTMNEPCKYVKTAEPARCRMRAATHNHSNIFSSWRQYAPSFVCPPHSPFPIAAWSLQLFLQGRWPHSPCIYIVPHNSLSLCKNGYFSWGESRPHLIHCYLSYPTQHPKWHLYTVFPKYTVVTNG